MTKHSLTRKQSTSVVKALLDNPGLADFIPELPPPTLNKLINFVGPEDAGALVAYTTNRQLRAIFDESLWQALAPGAAEIHRPEEFIRWLYILQDHGDTFMADKLQGLGVEYLVLNFAQIVKVNSAAAILGEEYQMLERFQGPEGYAEEFNNYYVTATFDEEWDITRAALIALQQNHLQVFEHMLYLLSQDAGHNLMQDISGERRDKKESDGFVSSESAKAFFELIRITPLQEITINNQLDPVSQRYFSQLGTLQDDVEQPNETQTEAPNSSHEQQQAHNPAEERSKLNQILIDADILSNQAQPLLLSGPAAGPSEVPLKDVLDAMQSTDPSQFAFHMSELAYLSNTVMSGITLNGTRFDQVEAANAVLATCNLGASYLGADTGKPEAMQDGLVYSFRIGWKILLRTPLHMANTLAAHLASSQFSATLYDRQWILGELATTLDELLLQIEQRKFEDVKDTITFLSLVLSNEDCTMLKAVLADFPQQIKHDELAYIATTNDLRELEQAMMSTGSHS